MTNFLGLPVAIPAGHDAKETLRSPVLKICEPPERRLQARLPAPLRAVNGPLLRMWRLSAPCDIETTKPENFCANRRGGLKGRLQA